MRVKLSLERSQLGLTSTYLVAEHSEIVRVLKMRNLQELIDFTFIIRDRDFEMGTVRALILWHALLLYNEGLVWA
jgi:hypothetical protein